ncbi:MAG TPA: DUF1294 domain-containing protein [Planctomycetota bacterium]|nr:DUF1294 domain-containing protein [Planctomycetota bacterium]
MPRPLWLLLLAVNAVTFLVYGYDKWCARQGWRRVSEANLLWLAFAGGLFGAWLGVGCFHHKTNKRPFRWRLIAVTLLNPFWALLYYLRCW